MNAQQGMTLPDTAKWSARLTQWRPWLPHGARGIWPATWGLPPDSSGTNPSIPPMMLRDWLVKYRAEMAKARGADERAG